MLFKIFIQFAVEMTFCQIIAILRRRLKIEKALPLTWLLSFNRLKQPRNFVAPRYAEVPSIVGKKTANVEFLSFYKNHN